MDPGVSKVEGKGVNGVILHQTNNWGLLQLLATISQQLT